MLKNVAPSARRSFAAHLYLQVLKSVLALAFFAQSFQAKVKDRMAAIAAGISVFFLGLIGSTAFAQMTGGGNTNPDDIINKAVCGSNGWLTWFTSTKFLVVILAGGLVAYFIGKAVGKRDNDGILGAFIAVLGLGALRILVKIVTSC